MLNSTKPLIVNAIYCRYMKMCRANDDSGPIRTALRVHLPGVKQSLCRTFSYGFANGDPEKSIMLINQNDWIFIFWTLRLLLTFAFFVLFSILKNIFHEIDTTTWHVFFVCNKFWGFAYFFWFAVALHCSFYISELWSLTRQF